MNLIVLHTAPVSLLEKFIETASGYFQYSRIKVVSKRAIECGKDIDKIELGRNPNYRDLLKVSRKGDVIVLLYNNVRGEGYYKYELMLSFLFGRKVYVFNIHEYLKERSKLQLFFGLPFYYFQKFFRFPIEVVLLFVLKGIFFGKLLLKNTKKSNLKNLIVFATHFGRRLPSARVRCYEFGDVLKKRGIESCVVSMEDSFGICNDGVSPFEKFIGNLLLAQKLIEKKPNILCVLKSDYHYVSVLFAKKYLGCRLIFDIDDWEADDFVFGFKKRRKVEALLKKYSYGVVCASEFLINKFKDCKTVKVPTGVDTVRFNCKNGKNRGAVVCGWVGMIATEDVMDNLFFLYDCVRKASGKVILKIAAGGVLFERAKRLGERILNERVEFYKNVPFEKVNEFICSVDFGVIPFVNKSEYNMGKSPTKLMEFMSAGKPCIVSKIGECEYIIKDGENGFLAQTKEDFIERINLLSNDELLRKKMGKKARKTMLKEYDVEACASKYFDFIAGKKAV